MVRYAALLLLFFIFPAMAEDNKNNKDNGPLKKGNFALPSSQQVGPLIGLGQNMVGEKITQWYMYAEDLAGQGQHFVEAEPSFLYGFSDKFSIFISVPVSINNEQQGARSHGFEDASAQLEYAFYAKETKTSTEQATVVLDIIVPTGSVNKQPNTGAGAMSFLVGATYNRMYYDWYGYVSVGAVLNTKHSQTHFGNSYLYQGGVSRILLSQPDAWIFALLLEVDGEYADHDTLQGLINMDSGGNVIMVTPSLWFSTKKWVVQAGAGVPVYQSLLGQQNHNHYLLALNVGWTP